MKSKLVGLFGALVVVTNTDARGAITATFEDPASDSAYTGASFGDLAPTSVQTGGPTGNYFQLQPDGVGGLSNTLNFAPSGANTSNLHAEFDFRMTPDGASEKAEGFGFSIYDVVAYDVFAPPADFTQLDINDQAVTWEQPRWHFALSVGFDLKDDALETQKNMVTLNANGARIASQIVGGNLNDGAFSRVILDVQNNGDDALASLSLIQDVHGTPNQIDIFTDQPVLGYAIPGSGLAPTDPTGWGVAFGGRTGGSTVGIDLDNISVGPAGAIPEPSTGLLLLVSALGFVLKRARR